MTPIFNTPMNTSLTQPIKWHGGKHYLASQIISLMPPHLTYVEPFFGGGSVLLQKNPDGINEVVNDLAFELTNFWLVLRDEQYFRMFLRRIEAQPFSELLFEDASSAEPSALDSLTRALNFFILNRQSRQGLMHDFATLTKNRTRRGMNEQVSSWLTAVEGLPEVHARLSRVMILNRNALDVIRQLDTPQTLFYCDPPYLHETRKSTGEYQFEMTTQQHIDLLLILSRVQGKFILSGYPSNLYKHWAEHFSWRCKRIEIDNKASSAAVKEKKLECLWMNF